MSNYFKLSSVGAINTNFFKPLFGCFEDLCSCSMGLFFPYCLFGRIYEISGFGKCYIGCCKYFSIQFFISLLFSIIGFKTEWDLFYGKIYKIENEINNCITNQTCKTNYDNFNTTLCNINNNTVTCECLEIPLQEKCNFTNNTLENMIVYISFISIMNNFTLYLFLGLFLGNYRTKISHKYNILYNSRYNFLIHFLPCTNPCALCQEYNTVNYIETVLSTYPITNSM